MSTEAGGPDEWDELDTETLRERAFAVARQRHDVGFFVDLLRHLPHSRESALLDDSSGSIGEFLDEVVGVWREFTGHADYGEHEPLLRARFVEYLRTHT